MKGKRPHYAGKQGSKVTNVVQRMLQGGGRTSGYHRGEHMMDEPMGRAMKEGRSPGGKSSGGKKRR